MDDLELCGALDQYEPLYSDLYVGEFAYRRGHELVTIHPDDLPGECRRPDTYDTQWTRRRKIWHSISGICQS